MTNKKQGDKETLNLDINVTLKKVWDKNKRILATAGVIILTFILSNLIYNLNTSHTGTNNNQSSAKTASLPNFPVTSVEDIATLKSKVNKGLTYDIVNGDPSKYKGQVIQWGGRVFVEPEKDNSGVYLQVYAGDNDKNFIVAYRKPDFEVKKDDYIIVTGTVEDEFNGENGFGAKISAPLITAGLIEAGTRSQAVAPSLKTVPLNQTQTQNGFTITLERLEIAADETRFFIKVKNNSGSKVSLYTYSAKATQGSKQLEAKSIYNSSEELPSEYLSGVEASGSLVFPKLDESPKQVVLYLDKPYSIDNWQLDWKDITFTVNF